MRILTSKKLTVEHVPPKGLGGRGMLLTCDECNHYSGTKFDAHAIREDVVSEFLSAVSTSTTELRSTIEIGGIRARGTVQRTSNGFFLMSHPKQNNEALLDGQVQDSISRLHTPIADRAIKSTVGDRYHPERANLSWTRAAYLAAFAIFGWRYIMRPALIPVRRQLLDAESKILPLLKSYSPDALPDASRILVVREPHELRGIFVAMGRHGVLLPGIDNPLSCDQLMFGCERRWR